MQIRRLRGSSEDKTVLLIWTFTALRGVVRIARVLLRDEFVPQEFKIRAVPGNNLTLTHQTLFPTNRISLLLQLSVGVWLKKHPTTL